MFLIVRNGVWILEKVDDVLFAFLLLLSLWIAFKFKDRILAAIGVEQTAHLIGDWRDWMTCWGMHRFEPAELFIWKVENLRANKNIFVKISIGYNNGLRTRVHKKSNSGSTASISGTGGGFAIPNNTTSMQLTQFDPNNPALAE